MRRLLLLLPLLCCAASRGAEAVVDGELKVWHRVAVTVEGPQADEAGDPNPFTDVRMTVRFRKGDAAPMVVPGFFAADGDAAETGATAGNRWRAYFLPPEPGEWRYEVSLRTGEGAALADDPAAGEPTAGDGASGTFTVAPSDKTGRDARAHGLLRYVGAHHWRFAGSGEWFLKGGADSPENLLGYADFDDTRTLREGHGLHRYEPHLADWRPGDPTWRDGRGKGLIGALNYLAGKGMNSVYFLTLNTAGDGRDVWPWTAPGDWGAAAERMRYDVSKLEQWEIVFSHMDRLGILLHVLTQESENDKLLDRGELGPQRRLYYRELVARFAHHPALIWNLGEENNNTTEQQKAFATWFAEHDAYGHPVVIHTFPNQQAVVYPPLLGFPALHGPSMQVGNPRQVHDWTLRWRRDSARSGHPWVVNLDEIGPASIGVAPDAIDPTHDLVRQHALWGNLLGGGGGVEWYFGYSNAHNDLNLEDWRSRDAMWDQTRYALDLMRTLPFWTMRPADHLVSAPGAYCLAGVGETYAIYLPPGTASEATLDLGAMALPFRVQWFNPRAGGALADGSMAQVTGPGKVALGAPPADPEADWVVVITRIGDAPLHTLTVPGIGSGRYPQGAVIEVIAPLPPAGHVFDRWTGDIAALADPNAPETAATLPAGDVRLEPAWREGTSAALQVVGFTLLNADTGEAIGPLTDGMTLTLADLPPLAVRADTRPAMVGSVRLELDGRPHVENSAPYSLTGDTDGKHNPWTPAPGEHRLTATAYAEQGAKGEASAEVVVRFTVR